MNFQLTLPFSSKMKSLQHQLLFYMNKTHSCIQPNSTVFALWVIAKTHPGRSRIQWKMGKKREEKKDSCGNDTMLTDPKSAGLATQTTWKMYTRANTWLAFSAQPWKWGAFPDRALFQICLAESNWGSDFPLIKVDFPFPGWTLWTPSSLCSGEVLKSTSQHWAGFGSKVFHVRLAKKGF